ncbi:MAG TPA: helix-turn-helix transcriptional regulator [Micromonosporaceae bacterium]|nr:helix-turn-helix transcriptional regulator [Micromonosporaceae bacterium]
MSATPSGTQPATDATQPATRLRIDIFDRRAEALGAETDADKARLIGVDRVTLWRYRSGRLVPSLDRAMTIANILGLAVDELFEQVAA